jgi:putative transposase
VTVIRDCAGRYFASFVVQADCGALPQAEAVIGIDLGLQHFAVLSDGTKIASPRFLRRAENKLRAPATPQPDRCSTGPVVTGPMFHRAG